MTISAEIILNLTNHNPEIRAKAIEQVLLNEPEPGSLLAQAILDTKKSSVCLDLLAGLARLSPDAVLRTGLKLLEKGDTDVIAWTARLLQKICASLPFNQIHQLGTPLEMARKRAQGSLITLIALDACTAAYLPTSTLPQFFLRLSTVDPEAWAIAGKTLLNLPEEELLRHWPEIVTALSQTPKALPFFAASLIRILESLAPEIQKEGKKPTEIAANLLLKLGQTEDAALKNKVFQAMEKFSSPLLRFDKTPDGKWQINPIYRNEADEILQNVAGILESPSGEAYWVSMDGKPIPAQEAAYGGCRCCNPSRALIKDEKTRPYCPNSGELYLKEGDGYIREKDHPLGGCGVCDSMLPLEKKENKVICPHCQTLHIEKNGRYVQLPAPPKVQNPQPRSNQPQQRDQHRHRPPGKKKDGSVLPRPERGLPKPPGEEELKFIEPVIQRAMGANVFLSVTGYRNTWTGSGIIIAQEGNEAAILTNYHVAVGDPTLGRIKRIEALTIMDELIPAQLVWAAARGVDLAICSVSLQKLAAIAVTPVGQGECLVGSELFAIGNPMGLSWSYTTGSLSSFRHNMTQKDLPIKLIQTQVPIALGSSGGGLYHKNGHLVGIISFLQKDQVGSGEMNFAISVPTIRDTLAREQVTWKNRPLLDLSI